MGNPTYTQLSNYDVTHNCSFNVPIKALNQGTATITGVLPDGTSASYTVEVLFENYDIDVDFGASLQIDSNNQVCFYVAVIQNDELIDDQSNISVTSNNQDVLKFNKAVYDSNTKYTKLCFDYINDGTAEIYINQDRTKAETLITLNISNEYVKEHLEFADSRFENELMNARYANVIQSNLNDPKHETAYYCYEIIDGANNFLSYDFCGFENPYQAIFSDYLTNQSTVDALEKSYDSNYYEFAIKNSSKIKKFTKKYWSEKWNEKTDSKTLFDFIAGKTVSSEFSEKMEKIFKSDSVKKELLGYLDLSMFAASKVMSVGSDITEFIKGTYDYANSINAYIAVSDEFKNTLDAAVNIALNENYSYGKQMKEVVDMYKAYTTDDYWEQMICDSLKQGFKLTNDLFGDVVIDGTMSFISHGLGLSSAALATISAVKLGYQAGFALQDFLTNNGDIHECRELLKANYHFENALYEYYCYTKSKLKNQPTFENAVHYDSAYNLLKQAQIYSLNTYIKDLQYEQHSLFGSVVNGFKDNYCDSDIQAAQQFALWWQSMRCHMCSDTPGISLITVACPTNVYVYKNNDGLELVAKVENGVAVNTTNYISCGVIGDTKYISVPNTDEYTIITTATASGKMDFIVSNYDSQWNPERSYGYIDVPLECGNSYGCVSSGEYTDGYVLVDMQTQEIIDNKDIDVSEDDFVKAEEILLNSSKNEIIIGETLKIDANVLPENASIKTLRWSSSDTGVAVVNENGVVTGKSCGTVIITATSVNDDTVKAEYSVTVSCTCDNYSFLNILKPTCENDGYSGDIVCNDCGKIIGYGNVIPANGHNYGDGNVAKYPTCTSTGTMTYTCTVCGEMKTEEIAKTAHTYSDYVTPAAPAQPVASVTNTPAATQSATVKKPKATSIKKLTKGKKSFKVTWKKVSGVSGYQIQYSTSKKFTKKTTKSKTYKGNKSFTKTISKLKAKKTYYVRIRTYKTVKVNGKSAKIYSNWSKIKSVKTK